MEFNYFDDKAAAWDDDKKYRRAKKIFVRINDFIKDKNKLSNLLTFKKELYKSCPCNKFS